VNRKRRNFALATALGILLLATGIAVEWGTPWSVAPEVIANPIAKAKVASGFTAELQSDRLLTLAAALRKGDLQEARQELGALSSDDRRALGDPDTILGLAAWANGDAGARKMLRAAPDDGPLADWRLLALAELAADDGAPEAALRFYADLVANHPASPLRPEAVIAAARLHHDSGNSRAALNLVELVRQEGGPGELRVDAEELAWEIGRALSDDGVRREAGRRLLTIAPWRASALGATDLFKGRGGKIDWRGVLTPAELERRAATFLKLGEADAARITLDDVAPADRALSWYLLTAEALTDLGRGREALAALEVPAVRDSEERATVEYRRGLAALDLADRRGGGKKLSADERAWMRSAARRHFERASELTADTALAVDSLRHLYGTLDGDDRRGQRAVLAKLHRYDPNDRTGAEPLWEEGWAAYQRGDAETAVERWSDLAELYPGSREAHRGLYWKARALEDQGREGSARRVYEALLETSDTTDFYRRQALVRLGSTPWLVGTAAEEVVELKPWEIDPRLERAKLLTDLGLDRLAKRETEIVAEVSDPRDATALSAMILSRSGEHREAMGLLRKAYPQLGGPFQGAIPTDVLRAYYPLAYADEIREGARRTGLPPYLVAGIIRQESAFDPRATSHAGARGLMQLMPPTAREVAESLGHRYDPDKLYDPQFSILLGSTYFSRVLKSFDGNVELALAGYNGGPNRIRRLWKERESGAGVDEFFETLRIDESRNYVKRILVLADSYRRLYPDEEAVETIPTAG
jgi:soluble lytic murein transglycosylase